MFQEGGKTIIEDDDQCMTCQHRLTSRCTLMQLFGLDLAILPCDITISDCPFFQKSALTVDKS
jgi:hypothetical protein